MHHKMMKNVTTIMSMTRMKQQTARSKARPPITPGSIRTIHNVTRRIRLTIRTRTMTLNTPRQTTMRLRLKKQPRLTSILPTPTIKITRHTTHTMALLGRRTLNRRMLNRPLKRTHLRRLLPHLRITIRMQILRIYNTLINIHDIPRRMTIIYRTNSNLNRNSKHKHSRHSIVTLNTIATLMMQIRIHGRRTRKLLNYSNKYTRRKRIRMITRTRTHRIHNNSTLIRHIMRTTTTSLSHRSNNSTLPTMLTSRTLTIMLHIIRHRLNILSNHTISRHMNLPIGTRTLYIRYYRLDFLSVQTQ